MFPGWFIQQSHTDVHTSTLCADISYSVAFSKMLHCIKYAIVCPPNNFRVVPTASQYHYYHTCTAPRSVYIIKQSSIVWIYNSACPKAFREIVGKKYRPNHVGYVRSAQNNTDQIQFCSACSSKEWQQVVEQKCFDNFSAVTVGKLPPRIWRTVSMLLMRETCLTTPAVFMQRRCSSMPAIGSTLSCETDPIQCSRTPRLLGRSVKAEAGSS